MGDVVCANAEECGKIFVVWPLFDISLRIIHYMGAFGVCHFQHDLSLKPNHRIRSVDHSFPGSVRSTPAVDASL